ncbi:hypothetical protein IEQ34_002155 [Dendrobium chrysotoxum]|uniref:Uncharacterized protein n=1 Tax=Dendrobium chrysotoxum TaxID=161865 RepID=A0AAV7HMM3_DENCH|nr:hypothetical protein IEQ34_002155 [Dendrobium chrysotoxum]
MNGGPSGFQNAPVTRNLVIFCAFLTVLFVARGRSTSLGFSYQDIIQRLRFFRVIASIFAFSSIPELIFGVYLLYYFRLFERQIGSNKYSVFVLFSLSASLLLDVLALVFLKVFLFFGVTLDGAATDFFSAFVGALVVSSAFGLGFGAGACLEFLELELAGLPRLLLVLKPLVPDTFDLSFVLGLAATLLVPIPLLLT